MVERSWGEHHIGSQVVVENAASQDQFEVANFRYCEWL